MKDETANNAETTAFMVATCVRLSQMLNVPLEDAASLLLKYSAALDKAAATAKRAS